MHLLTAHASQDDLSPDDYRDIWEEVSRAMSLRQFAALAGIYSASWWLQYGRGDKPLTHAARQALRRIVGLPALPLPVSAALAGVHPDAEVYQVGDEDQARRVLLLATPGPVTVHWNGNGPQQVEDARQIAPTPNVTGVTSAQRRKGYWRPTLPAEWRQRAESADVDVRQVLLSAIEEAEKRSR